MLTVLAKLNTIINNLEEANVAESATINEIFLRIAKNHGGLDDWFKNEKWVDLRRPKEKGKGYKPCGRRDTETGDKPVCAPANKAKNLDSKERTQRLKEKAKSEKTPSDGKKPKNTEYSDGAGGKSNIS